MLRKIRIVAAVICFTLITLLFLDFTGTLHAWFGWLAKIQLLPAILAVNIGIIIFLALLTVIFGRVYCSVICPLGVYQDIVSRIGKKKRKLRFRYKRPLHWLRYGILIIFCIALIIGISSIVSILDPYSAYGRIATNIFAPLYQLINNALAYIAERFDSYAFYSVDIWVKSTATLAIAIITIIVVSILAWRNGRTYCNTICPVGTVLGFISRFSIFKPRFESSSCNNCGLCERACKASCINSKEQKIDYSSCVACMDCVSVCNKGSMKYLPKLEPVKAVKTTGDDTTDNSRRQFLTLTATMAVATALKSQSKVDGGLAIIEDKKIPKRSLHITPPGSSGVRHFNQHCTSCQLCVSVCPNQILRPSDDITRFMQPELSYERGFCRPECTKCSEVCPAGAIRPVTTEEKSSLQIGHAVWIMHNCVVITDGVKCGNCARRCPAGAIIMVPQDIDNPESLEIPAIDTERCIGCGACEYLCPSRPFSAIYVEGNDRHRII